MKKQLLSFHKLVIVFITTAIFLFGCQATGSDPQAETQFYPYQIKVYDLNTQSSGVYHCQDIIRHVSGQVSLLRCAEFDKVILPKCLVIEIDGVEF